MVIANIPPFSWPCENDVQKKYEITGFSSLLEKCLKHFDQEDTKDKHDVMQTNEMHWGSGHPMAWAVLRHSQENNGRVLKN